MDAFEDGWRAALEWVLKSQGRGKIRDEYLEDHDVILVSTIEKELEDSE